MNITPQALDFLFENRLKDSKEWYKEHKDIHTKFVVEPFREFVVNITPYMSEIDPAIICNPKKISRIYRDARFSKDKSIFKDNQWCCFMNSERKELYEGLPSFFFDFSPRGFKYGCGYYKAGKSSIEALRSLVLKKDKTYLAARKAVESDSRYILDCNPYKKDHFPEADEIDRSWLNIRDFCVLIDSTDFYLLFSDNLADEIGKEFIKLKPVYDFLMKAESINTERMKK